MPPIVNIDKCSKCGMCVSVCPQDVFFASRPREIPVVSYPEECWHCNACVQDCPTEDAIKLRIPFPMFLPYK
jgi:adenylylsulfate reductase, subunit B